MLKEKKRTEEEMNRRIVALLLMLSFSVTGIACAEDITSRATKVTTVPNENTVLIDYASGTNPIYIGWSPRGAATTDLVWFIIKITWDANNNPTAVKSYHDGAWDSRTGYTYA